MEKRRSTPNGNDALFVGRITGKYRKFDPQVAHVGVIVWSRVRLAARKKTLGLGGLDHGLKLGQFFLRAATLPLLQTFTPTWAT